MIFYPSHLRNRITRLGVSAIIGEANHIGPDATTDLENKLKIIKWMVRAGASIEEISSEVGLCTQNIRQLINDNPETFKYKRNVGKLEESLIKMATGYEVEDVEIIASKDGKPIRVRKTKRHIQPSVEACKLLLHYRSGDWA